MLFLIFTMALIAMAMASLVPTIGRAGDAIVSAADVASERRSSRIDIIHVAGAVGTSQVEIWVKNVGTNRLVALERTDVFFGTSTDLQGIPYGGTGCTAPCWQDELENDTEWDQAATLHITVSLTTPLAASTLYSARVVAPTGVDDTALLATPP